MNGKARSTSSGENREGGATPLINSKNHGPASDPLGEHGHRCIYLGDRDYCAGLGFCRCECGATMGWYDDEWTP